MNSPYDKVFSSGEDGFSSISYFRKGFCLNFSEAARNRRARLSVFLFSVIKDMQGGPVDVHVG